ncbi:MAG: methyltransferase [Dehalococcoidia bacterium]|nr:methyltransferase [Dehalococcoidia bacterium]
MTAKGPRGVKSLMDLAVGYQRSMVLLSANRIGVFGALAGGPLSSEEVASSCGSQPRSTAMLLNACAALGLLSKDQERFSNRPLASRFLVPGKDTYLGNYLGLMEDGYEKWGHLGESVIENRRASSPARDSGRDPQWNRRFTLAMRQGARAMARQVAKSVDLRGCRKLIDVGGGPGVFAMEMVRRNPGLEATVFDIPGVLEIAREIIEESGLKDRIHLQPGDYHKDSFGVGNDVVLLFGILHSESLASRKRLLEKAWESLAPGGLVLVRQFLLEEDRAGPLEATLFSLQMLLYTDSGEGYTWRDIESWLKECNFVNPSRKLISARRPYSLVLARKP